MSTMTIQQTERTAKQVGWMTTADILGPDTIPRLNEAITDRQFAR
ncbi:MAG: hypothetical protein JWL69_3039 [Phycisphaerales bacterium]|nr:hypothetical protein [Phycisphaerales bacterium]MDB5353573.1 hypothetical protein [Phycisphaerales bacterium]